MARSQLLLDTFLSLQQPIHRQVERILIGLHDPEVLRQRGRGPPARGGKLGVGCQYARGYHGAYQVALRLRPGTQQFGEIKPLHGYSNSLNMAMRQRPNGFKQLSYRPKWLATQHSPDGLDLLLVESGQIRQSALAYARTIAVRLAQ